MPNNYFVYKGEKCHGGKLSKERLTVLVCANVDGSERLPPLVTGKYKKSRCFKNVRSFPCDYVQRKAWMTGEIFVHGLKNWVSIWPNYFLWIIILRIQKMYT